MQEIPSTLFKGLSALPTPLHGKRVLLRIDCNDGGTSISSMQHRVQAVLPTLQWLLERGARVAILSHRGRPQGRPKPELSTAPLAVALAELLGQPVPFVPDCLGRIAQTAVAELAPGQVVMLENTRFHLGEQLNQQPFAAQLATLGDYLVNDAFACAHRTQASTHGLAALLPTFLGLQFVQELQWLENWAKAAHPKALLVGGNAVVPKLELLQRSLGKVQIMLLGGVVGQTFLAAKDLHLRQSLIEFGAVEGAREFMAEAGVLGCRVHLPRDVAVAKQSLPGLKLITRAPHQLAADEVAQDLGPLTLETWQKVLEQAPSVVWFGSLGVWQHPEFRLATMQLANMLLARQQRQPRAFTLLGGNGLLQALAAENLLTPLAAAGVAISTGGGALQQALCGHSLPAVQAVIRA